LVAPLYLEPQVSTRDAASRQLLDRSTLVVPRFMPGSCVTFGVHHSPRRAIRHCLPGGRLGAAFLRRSSRAPGSTRLAQRPGLFVVLAASAAPSPPIARRSSRRSPVRGSGHAAHLRARVKGGPIRNLRCTSQEQRSRYPGAEPDFRRSRQPAIRVRTAGIVGNDCT